MTPQEKAQALISKFSHLINFDFVSDRQWHSPIDEDRNKRVKKDAIKCALATVEEIIEQNNIWIAQTEKGTNNYWIEVKKELNKFNP